MLDCDLPTVNVTEPSKESFKNRSNAKQRMLEHRLQILERIKHHTRAQLAKLPLDAQRRPIAFEELELNAASALVHLEGIYRLGGGVTEDLKRMDCRVEESKRELYEARCSGLQYHLTEMKTIPQDVQHLNWSPTLASEEEFT